MGCEQHILHHSLNKTEGAFFSPMGMTVHWTGPHGVHIQVRGLLSFLNGIW